MYIQRLHIFIKLFSEYLVKIVGFSNFYYKNLVTFTNFCEKTLVKIGKTKLVKISKNFYQILTKLFSENLVKIAGFSNFYYKILVTFTKVCFL